MVTEGIEFINASPDEVINYLQDLGREKLRLSPANLKIKSDSKFLILSVMDKGVEDYPIRKSFLYKLLKWYSFPMNQLYRLSNETLISICNDYLININREFVNVTIEKGEALTITSPDYNEITDLEVIKKCADLGVRTVSRNDFMMRITTEEMLKFEAVKGDNCGIGLNVINSETGFRTLSVAHFILRYVCSNRAIVRIDNEANERVHYGYKENELQEFLDEQVELALLKQKDVANSIKNLSNKSAAKFIESVNKRVELYLGKNESKGFLGELNEKSTLYDLFNAITNKAKKYDLGKRVLLENLAGDLILN
ncbi:MAG TPA: hypothetical protein PKD67_10865 [Ignavibacteriaceae bacterium]|nr:hypothetical protein [Ignavibacteriaceae bacterium]